MMYGCQTCRNFAIIEILKYHDIEQNIAILDILIIENGAAKRTLIETIRVGVILCNL